MPLTSFDCFDTLVTRAVGDPASVGYVVARRLRETGVCDVEGAAYVTLRGQAGQMVFRRLVDRATLHDVCVQLADLLGLPAEAAASLVTTEVEVETQLIRPVPGGVAALLAARAAGDDVAVITDTVLPEQAIRRLLEAASACPADVPLWVSNELGAGKGRGTAYAAVARAMDRVPARWRHVGDDERGDVMMARAAGITPQRATRGLLTRHEKAWEAGAVASGGVTSLMAGAARRARLVAEVQLPGLPEARATVLAGVGAPLAAAYVLWALRQVRAVGAHRLALAVDPSAALVPFAQTLADASGGGVLVHGEGGSRPEEAGAGGAGHPGVVAGWGWGLGAVSSGDRAARPRVDWRAGSDGSSLGWLADAASGTGPALDDARLDEEAGELLRLLSAGTPDDGSAGSLLALFAAELAPVLTLLGPHPDVRTTAWRAIGTLAPPIAPRARPHRLLARVPAARRHATSLLTVTARRLVRPGPPGVTPTASTSAPRRPSRYEDRLREASTEGGDLPELLADACAAVRIDPASRGVEPALVDVTAGVAGPLLSGYVLWCLQRAREAGCRRVCFVARDGEVLLRLAQRITAARGEDGWDLRYLHGSRRAWLLPSLERPDVERIADVAGWGHGLTVRDVLAWVSIAPEDTADALVAAGFAPETWGAPVPSGRRRALLDVLAEPAVAPLLVAAADAALTDAGRYLRAQGLLDGEPFVIVDMEGHGNIGALLTALLARLDAPPPAVECYIALTRPVPSSGRYPVGYLYDDGRGTGVRERSGEAYVALEVFGAGSHGTVLGYRTVDGETLPVLASPTNDRVLAWGLAGYRRLLDVYGDALGAALATSGAAAAQDASTTTWTVLRDFWERPTPAEVATWGTFPSPDDGRPHTIGDGFTTSQVVRSLRGGRVSMRPRGTWPAAVRAGAPWHLRVLQQQLERRRRRTSGVPRVLMVEPRLSEDGATRSTLRLVQHWSRAQVPVVLFAVQRPPRRGGAPVPADVHVTYPTATDPRGRWLRLSALARLVPHAVRADVVVSARDVGWGLLLARAASWIARRPFAVVVRSSPARAITEHVPPRLRGATRLAYRTADRVVCISPGLVPEVVAMGVRPGRVRMALGGVEVQEVRAAAAAGTPQLPPGSGPLVVGIGRLERQKGFDVLIRAHAAAVAAGAHHRLLILGEGLERPVLTRLAAELGVTDSVHLPGFCAQPLPMLAAADLFVLSSRWEGLAQTLAEAMLLAVPIIATDCVSGPRLLLADGAHGDLVAVDDVDALAAAITAHLNAPRRLRASAQRGSAWASDHLDIARAARDTLEALGSTARRA